MKYIILATLSFFFFFFSTVTANQSNTNCIDFVDWKICLNVINKWNWNYKVSRNITVKSSSTNLIMLNCRILTPWWKIQNIWACDWSFNDNYNWNWSVRFYVDFQNERKVLNTDLSFLFLNNSQYTEFNSVYKMWPWLVRILERNYSKLNSSVSWKNFANEIYSEMNNVISLNDSSIKSYKDFHDLVTNFVLYTLSVR